jgi:hypothetical protein
MWVISLGFIGRKNLTPFQWSPCPLLAKGRKLAKKCRLGVFRYLCEKIRHLKAVFLFERAKKALNTSDFGKFEKIRRSNQVGF